jgi:NDP-sugar pyrophosphorylase family protein
MKAMVFAAGLGTRLQPLTDDRPKALVEIEGVALLETTIRRLISVGVDQVIVNVHHFAEQIIEYLKTKGNFGIHIEVSVEGELLETGGGLKQAGWFFDDGQPFFIHNVDVLSDIDLGEMMERHIQQDALVTLAVKTRKTSRYLLFNKERNLRGWQRGEKMEPELVIGEEREDDGLQRFGFCGIHVVSPRLLPLILEHGRFSIIQTYMRLVGEGHLVKAFDVTECRWKDVGKIDELSPL